MNDQFIQSVNEFLISMGYTKTDNIYEKSAQVNTPGRIMIINGNQMQEPGQIINIKYTIEDLGDGYVSNADDTNKSELEFFEFQIYTNDNVVSQFTKSYYVSDIEEFKTDVHNLMQQTQ